MPGSGIKVTPLGAGRDIGRSCILLSMGGKNIMLDCGIHMGYSDHRKFPDFSYISRTRAFDKIIDCVIISHFHLDHVGALPHFTEICGYDGPIYMTYPTKAICPILLEDMRRVFVERRGESQFFTSEDIKKCMKKVIAVDLHETVWIDEKINIKAYHASHVIGAAMFLIRVGEDSVVYTGDFNVTPDRHLGAAFIEKCRPSLLITETTYATTVRKSRRAREREFLEQVHECVKKGGKALIPVFALGRAQELCILIEDYWDRMDDLRGEVPVYFSAGLAEHATYYYRLFINWTNERIKRAFIDRNMFHFEHIKVYNSKAIDEPGPVVLFASPGMLHAGTSLEVFKKWCSNPGNTVILPGYCVAGTVGAKVLAGEKSIELDRFTTLNVKLNVKNLSFSAHADSKGILQLIKMCRPKHVMLVHGEAAKMSILKEKIQTEINIPCIDPANGDTIQVDSSGYTGCTIDTNLAKCIWRKHRELALRRMLSGMKAHFENRDFQIMQKSKKRRMEEDPFVILQEAPNNRLTQHSRNPIGKQNMKQSVTTIAGMLLFTEPEPVTPHSKWSIPDILHNGNQGSVKLLSTYNVTASSSKIELLCEMKCPIDSSGAFAMSIADGSFEATRIPANLGNFHKFQSTEPATSANLQEITLNEIAINLILSLPDHVIQKGGSASISIHNRGEPPIIELSFKEDEETALTVKWNDTSEDLALEVVQLIRDLVR